MVRSPVGAVVLGVLLVAVTACGGGGEKLYEAKATYRCFSHRPEYRPLSFNWYPGKPGPRPPALAFNILAPRPGFRNRRNYPFRGNILGPSWSFGLAQLRSLA